MRRPRVKLDNFLAVITVAEKHDLDIAGSEMGLTPSAVRKQIELVEDVLGVPLFIGRNGHLTLTEEGEVFHAEAPKLLEHANLAEEKTIARLALKNHRLLVGHSTHLPPKLIALINRVRIEDAHAVHIQHISGLTSAMVRRVLEGSLHAGIGLLPIFNPDLLIRTISEEPLVVCIPSSHKLASKAVIYPRDLDGEPMIAASREPWPERHREVEDHFSDFGIGLEVVADAYSAREALTYVEQKVGFYLLAGVSRLLAPAWGSLNRRRQT
jgi:DNA-binding transcriptional LysR family regulator